MLCCMESPWELINSEGMRSELWFMETNLTFLLSFSFWWYICSLSEIVFVLTQRNSFYGANLSSCDKLLFLKQLKPTCVSCQPWVNCCSVIFFFQAISFHATPAASNYILLMQHSEVNYKPRPSMWLPTNAHPQQGHSLRRQDCW